MHLGWEPYGGYTLDVVSPLGCTGMTGVSFEEGRRYALSCAVPGGLPPEWPSPLPVGTCEPAPVDTSWSVDALLRPVPFYAGTLYSLDPPGDRGYGGSRWTTRETGPAYGGVKYVDTGNLQRYLDGRPFRALAVPFLPPAGDTCFLLLDNRGSLLGWRRFSRSGPVTAPRPLSEEQTSWLASTPSPPPSVRPAAGPPTSAAAGVEPPEWPVSLEGLVITQDDPDDPLGSGLVLGPFTLDSSERTLMGRTSAAGGVDLDLYVYGDADGDRSPDGAGEMVAVSGSPSSTESFQLTVGEDPGVWWLMMHGWDVPEGEASAALSLSAEPLYLRLSELSPSGSLASAPDSLSLLLPGGIAAGEELVAVTAGDTLPMTVREERACLVIGAESLTASTPEAGAPLALLMGPGGEVLDSARWSFAVDLSPPDLDSPEALPDLRSGYVTLGVTATDTVSGVASVKAAALGDTLTLRRTEGDRWEGRLDMPGTGSRSLEAFLTALDVAGNESAPVRLAATLPLPYPIAIADPAPVGEVYDGDVLLQVVARGRLEDAYFELSAEHADGRLVDCPVLLRDGGVVQAAPSEPLGPGCWTVKVTALDGEGEVMGRAEWNLSVTSMSIQM